MKFLNALFLKMMLIGMVLFSSCQKDEEPQAAQAINTNQAVELIANELAADNGGLAEEIEQAAQQTVTVSKAGSSGVSSTSNPNCGVSVPVVLNLEKPNGIITFKYQFSMSFLLSCLNNLPNTMALTFNNSGNYNSPRLQSNATTTANVTITGVNPATSQVLTFKGSYERNGTNTFKLTNIVTTSKIKLDMNLNVSTLNYLIPSGSGTIILSGTTNTGGQFNYQAQLTVLSDNLASLNINGQLFQINLTTGVYTQN